MGGRPLDDTSLIQRAQGGDLGAYGELMRRYQDVAFRTAYLITGSAAAAEDAAQEAFVKAYYALDRFRLGAPWRPWLLRIVANQARNQRKAEQRRASLALRVGEGRLEGDAAPSPEAAAFALERRQALLTALDSLREEDRLAISLRYFLDLTEEEMAHALDCPRGTVKSRLSRAMGRLRDELKRRGWDASVTDDWRGEGHA